MAKPKRKTSLKEIIIYVKCSFNNTICTITDARGNVVTWASAGKKFKGSKKSTAFAASVAVEMALKQFIDNNNVQEASNIVGHIRLKGPGAGKEPALRAIQMTGMAISSIGDITPIAHNGCRPPKRRRA